MKTFRNFVQRWKTRQEIKKSAAMIEKICDEAPLSFFTGMLANNDGSTLAPHEAINTLMRVAQQMRKSA